MNGASAVHSDIVPPPTSWGQLEYPPTSLASDTEGSEHAAAPPNLRELDNPACAPGKYHIPAELHSLIDPQSPQTDTETGLSLDSANHEPSAPIQGAGTSATP